MGPQYNRLPQAAFPFREDPSQETNIPKYFSGPTYTWKRIKTLLQHLPRASNQTFTLKYESRMKKYTENQQEDVHDTSIFLKSIKEKIKYRKGEKTEPREYEKFRSKKEL